MFIFLIFFLAYFLLFFRIQLLFVSVDGKNTIYTRHVRDGDLIEIGHVNSIYEKEVREVLRVNKGYMELIDVITDSFGVREYYRLEDEPKGRKWRSIKFINSKGRNFYLKIDGREIDIRGYVGRSILVEVCKTCVLCTIVKRKELDS